MTIALPGIRVYARSADGVESPGDKAGHVAIQPLVWMSDTFPGRRWLSSRRFGHKEGRLGRCERDSIRQQGLVKGGRRGQGTRSGGGLRSGWSGGAPAARAV